MKQKTETDASLTVEAAFVASLTLFTLFSVILMTFYLRDAAAVAARVCQLCMEQTVTDACPDDGAPVFTLTRGTVTVRDGTAAGSYALDGIWPVGLLRGEAAASRTLEEPGKTLRRARALPQP